MAAPDFLPSRGTRTSLYIGRSGLPVRHRDQGIIPRPADVYCPYYRNPANEQPCAAASRL